MRIHKEEKAQIMEGKTMDTPPWQCSGAYTTVNLGNFSCSPSWNHLQGGHISDTIEEIKENSPRDLKAIPKQAFQDCFQSWKKCCKQCICSREEYFESDKCNNIIGEIYNILWCKVKNFLNSPPTQYTHRLTDTARCSHRSTFLP